MTGTKKTIICVFVSVVLIAVPSFAWTNNNPVEIMKIDLTELRTYIDAIRTNIGLSAYSWTDSTLTGNTMFKLAHFQELRTAIEAVATASGATASQWGDTLASGGVMRLLHIVGPRSNITALNTTVNSWYCCGSYGGANTGSVGACPGTDDSACGTIDCDGLNYYFTEGSASPTGTNYCKLRNYYCTGNSCGETYSDSTAATCGTCKYATGACSSCTNYGYGTSCGAGYICDGSGSCIGAPCNLPWGGSINHGQSATAYAASSVSCGSSCSSQTRTCNLGTLSGSYQYGSCSVATCYCGDTHPCGVAGTSYYRYYGPGGGCGGPNGCQGTTVIGSCQDCPCAAC